MECEQAVGKGIEVLAFLVDEESHWPEKRRESFRLAAAAESGPVSSILTEEVERNLQGLRAFKAWLNQLAIRNTFSGEEDLARKVERALREWRDRHQEFGKLSGAREEEQTASRGVEQVEEEGLLDLVEKADHQFNTLTQVALRMAQDIGNLGNEVKEATQELQAATTSDGAFDRKGVKEVVNAFADRTMLFAKRLEGDIAVFRETYSKGLEAVEEASKLASDFGYQGLEGLQKNLTSIRVFRRKQIGSGSFRRRVFQRSVEPTQQSMGVLRTRLRACQDLQPN